jgi:hypothetical protein
MGNRKGPGLQNMHSVLLSSFQDYGEALGLFLKYSLLQGGLRNIKKKVLKKTSCEPNIICSRHDERSG